VSRGERSGSYNSRARGDDLTTIIGIDAGTADRLRQLGIEHFQQIANLTAGEIEAIERQLGIEDRIMREQWMEQAFKLINS
jgi:predicted flap endonuclease-1-like 5' DNA nuclease